MVDKLTAVPRTRLGALVGSLASDEMRMLNRAIFVFLGLSETDASRRLELAVVAVGGDAKVGADRVAATPPKEVAGPAGTGTPYAPRAESRVTEFTRIP